MKLETLIASLDQPDPKLRLDVVRVLGMLDEVRALDALRARYQAEPDAAVREAIAWAGKRLYQAQQAGYSTENEIFEYFGVNREIDNATDDTEAEMLRRLEDSFHADMLRMQGEAGVRRARRTLATGAGGFMLGGVGLGMAAMTSSMMSGVSAASSSLESGRPQIGMERAPATAPSTMDISVRVRQLQTETDPTKREQILIDLGQLNNPAALPHLAAVFVSDPVPQVSQTAQRCGKVIYWNALYWEMQQSGWLEKEINRRLVAAGKKRDPSTPAASPPAASSPPPPEAPQADVSEILRKAKEARDRRKRQ